MDRIDPESVSYNTNRLYIAGGKQITSDIEAAQERLHQSRFLDDNRWRIRDGLRYVVNSAFLAKNNAFVRPGDRGRAIQLFKDMANLWESEFNTTVDELAKLKEER